MDQVTELQVRFEMQEKYVEKLESGQIKGFLIWIINLILIHFLCLKNIKKRKLYHLKKHSTIMNSKSDVEENIELLRKKFKSIVDITVSYDRYDIILYSYDEIEEITKFIEEKTSVKSWTALKTKVNPETKIEWV